MLKLIMKKRISMKKRIALYIGLAAELFVIIATPISLNTSKQADAAPTPNPSSDYTYFHTPGSDILNIKGTNNFESKIQKQGELTGTFKVSSLPGTPVIDVYKPQDKAATDLFKSYSRPGVDCAPIIYGYTFHALRSEDEVLKEANKLTTAGKSLGLIDLFIRTGIDSNKDGPQFIMQCAVNTGGPSVNLNYKIPVGTGAPGNVSAGGTDVWFDTGNKPVGRDGVANRFVFISPKEIIDKKSVYSNGKFVVYSTGSDSSIFAPNQNNRPFNDGVYTFWPRKEDGSLWERDADTCHGGFAVQAGDGVYLTVFGVPSRLSNGKCLAGRTGNLEITDPANQGRLASGVDASPLTQKDYDITTILPWSSRKLSYSMFYWNSPTELKTYINPGRIYTKMPDADAKTFLQFSLKAPVPVLPTTEVWTSPDCPNNRVVLIIEGHDLANTTVTDADIHNQSVRGIFYVRKNDTDLQLDNVWDGSKVSCFLGHDVKNNPKRAEDASDSPYHITFIAYPGRGVGNAAGSFGDPGVTSGDKQQVANAAAKAGGAGDTTGDSCEKGDGALRWIMCPVIYALDGALSWVDSRVQELLAIDAGYYKNPELEIATANIRRIAYVVLVPIMLVMILSTALGFEFVSAYTVKRALPRVFAAVIFIALSYPICVFLIELSNAVGFGTLGIFTAPFKNAHDSASTLTLASLFDKNILGSIVAAPAVGIGVVIILWLFGGTLLLFIMVAFLVLMVRQILIVALLIVAPLAILAWIFPGNDKLWKAWWSSFSKLLILFPLIMALIATGRIFAFILKYANPSGISGGALTPLMILAAYMLPYALIPFTFKFAGGAFSTIAGMANDKSKGLFDRQREKRKKKVANVGERIQAGKFLGVGQTKFDANGKAIVNRRGRFNQRLQTASLLRKTAKEGGINRQFGANLAVSRENAELEHSNHLFKENSLWRAKQSDDDLMLGVLRGQGNYDKTRGIIKDQGGARFLNADGSEKKEELDNLTATAMRLRKSGGAATGISAFRAASTSSTTWKDEFEEDGVTRKAGTDSAKIKMLNDLRLAVGHDKGNAPNLISEMRSAQDQAGRPEIGSASFSDLQRAYQIIDDAGSAATPELKEAVNDALTSSALEGNPLGAFVTKKEGPAKEFTRIAVKNAEAAVRGVTPAKIGGAESRIARPEAHFDAVVQSLVTLEGARLVASSAGGAGVKAISTSLQKEVPTQGISPEIMAALRDEGNSYVEEVQDVIDSMGVATGEKQVVQRPIRKRTEGPLTWAKAIDNMQRTNPKMAASIKIYVEQAAAFSAQQAAAATQQSAAGQRAAQAAAASPNFIPPPGGPTSQGPIGSF